MSLTDLISPYLYNPNTNRWVEASSGRFVSERLLRAEIEALQAAANAALEGFTKDLFAGLIDLSDWHAAVAAQLKDAHLANAMFARGGRSAMDSEVFGRVGGNLADEFRYLQRLAEGIQDGSVSEGQALYRIQQYGNATEQAYTREWAIQRKRPEWSGLPVLNQVPRDGDTQCRGNCNCELDEREDGIHWMLNPGESCTDCERLAAGGPYQPGRV